MTEYKTVNEVYSNWLESGIFSDLQKYEVPWKDKNINRDLYSYLSMGQQNSVNRKKFQTSTN